ncbi:MAG: hypothetical protein LBT81_00385 [Helicobacteraceae bacterium]|jgi:hypothetical protein|nr:hypothetical protein [Helicobacteraceae bacterium]
MRRFAWKAIAIGVLLAPICLSADWVRLHMLAGYECEGDQLTLTYDYDGAYDEDGEKLIANKRDTQWDPWSLVTIEDTDGYNRIVGETSVKAECKLSDGVYRIEIFPVIGNHNELGRCGHWMGAKAQVIKGSKTLYEGLFSEHCERRDFFYPLIAGKVITRVIFTPKQDKPQIVSSSVEDFYNGNYKQ